MFRITEDPSSGSLVQWWAKNYKNDSIVSVDMDKVGVMAAYCDPLCVCVQFTAYILIVPTYYILPISWTINCLVGQSVGCYPKRAVAHSCISDRE